MKDILIQKKTIIFALLYTIFMWASFSSILPSGFGLYVMSPILVTYLFITFAVQYDDKNKCEVILNSLPLERTDIVIAKYISSFIFAFIGIICSILVGFIGNTTGMVIFIGYISLLDIVLIIMSISIFSSIYYPVYFKFGVSRIRMFNILIFMFLFFLPTLAIEYIKNNSNNLLVQKYTSFINDTNGFILNFSALIIGLIFLLISLMISIRIYNNKEF